MSIFIFQSYCSTSAFLYGSFPGITHINYFEVDLLIQFPWLLYLCHKDKGLSYIEIIRLFFLSS